jgi:hypothetical protein
MAADVRKVDDENLRAHKDESETTFTTKALAAGHHKMKINISVPPHLTKKHENL